ncbi:hypothetical protein U9M48_033076 [Paspalum notatum var. saurae]|uniref:Thaumatin-like protein n=1 Tax=Paspalum notatum var. saurae TaxID=547442 RepID=A0AAQ3UAJ9_PASNO
MATRAASRSLLALLLVLTVSASDDFAPSPKADTLNIKNNCAFKVALVISPKQGSPALGFTAVELRPYEYALGIPMPHEWSGRIWGRTDCSTDGNGKFTCATGDCGSGRMECGGGGRRGEPATVAVFALGGKGGRDAYGISLDDGYNLPMQVSPYVFGASQGGRQCSPARCAVDLDAACPADQQVKAPGGRVVACKPSGNSGFLKNACSTAKSLSCAVVDTTYTVTFCPDNSEF